MECHVIHQPVLTLPMKKLFPSWQGNFDGSRPSLVGLGNEHVISTLQRGLISETELNSLLHLIKAPDVCASCPAMMAIADRSPQSHFLKVPSLPFYSLISILSKFPADDDGRVFWSGNIRDSLYGDHLSSFVKFTNTDTLW